MRRTVVSSCLQNYSRNNYRINKFTVHESFVSADFQYTVNRRLLSSSLHLMYSSHLSQVR